MEFLYLMMWNWQQPDWPRFHWDESALAPLEARFFQNVGEQIGSIKHVDAEDRSAILIDMMTGEAIKTSEIEGELLDRDSVQSSLRHQFGLDTDRRRVSPAEAGIAEMMVDLYRNYAEPLSHDTLHRWHRMIANGRVDLASIGAYRSGDTPMQVVSGYLHKQKVHFEALPSGTMPCEMDAFIAWFVDTAPGGVHPLPPLTRAGLAHLYFVSIHPYEDGNGRISRALAEKALAQAIGQPSLIALSHVIQRKRAAYYDALEASNKSMAVSGWLTYFAETVLEAQARTQRLIDFLIAKTKLYDRMRDLLNERQSRAIARMFREGPDGFIGGLSAANYIRITDASRATATRDLADLVDRGVLIMSGTLKSTRYTLNLEGARPNSP
jgi:Fic family protein